jgi:nitroreductase
MKKTNRKSEHPIDQTILNRWSPRAMDGKAIDPTKIHSLFEAARWAPSSYNNQPWRFIYAKRDTKDFEVFMDLLVDFNKSWCKNAGLLSVVIALKNFEHNGKPCVTHAYDTGAAWENLSLEGEHQNLVVHGMQGFDYDKAKTALKIPDDYVVLAMFAAGNPAPKESLVPELLEKEVPSTRKKLEEIMMEGSFKG